MKITMAALVLIASSLCFANVSGDRVQTFGTSWNRAVFSRWLARPDALLTPESSGLAVQACLRDSQESLDYAAYATTKSLVSEMRSTFGSGNGGPISNPGGTKYARALSRLSELLERLDSISADRPEAFTDECRKVMAGELGDSGFRSEIEPLYDGRLNPRLSASLPPEWREKLGEKAAEGVRPAPLTWDELVKQVCVLEGYYGTSPREELWKFFALTRVMAYVLPAESEDILFVSEISRSRALQSQIRRLNQYSSVAGKFNGPTIGMTVEERAHQTVRFTGSALGSRATALMALFTTGWREGIQRYVLDQDYPDKPFRLTSAETVLHLLRETKLDAAAGRELSQTEVGMLGVWDSLFPKGFDTRTEEEAKRKDYATASGLAWLALNAESNIRQNEKITGFKGVALHATTTSVYGTSTAFHGLVAQIDAALDAYRNVDPEGRYRPLCLAGMRKLNEAAERALGAQPGVAQLSPNEVEALNLISFKPVIADIGLEVDDSVGDAPAGRFRLHLATGYGREFPFSIDGRDYTLWTPSAMVLHLTEQMTTATWRKNEVAKYDGGK